MIIESTFDLNEHTDSVALSYIEDGYDEYQCNEWHELIFKSINDLDNREIRIEILQHPFNCQHPTCIQVAKHMKGILK